MPTLYPLPSTLYPLPWLAGWLAATHYLGSLLIPCIAYLPSLLFSSLFWLASLPGGRRLFSSFFFPLHMGSIQLFSSFLFLEAGSSSWRQKAMGSLPEGRRLPEGSKRAYTFPILNSWHASCNARAIYLIDTTLMPCYIDSVLYSTLAVF